MPPRVARRTDNRCSGAWLDDLARIVAGWLDAAPVRRRALLVFVAVVIGPALISVSSYAWVALAMLALPRAPRLGGRVVFVLGLLLSLAGAATIVLHEQTWTSFPRESGGGLALLALGLLLGARSGTWLPWLLLGAVCGVVVESPFTGGVPIYLPEAAAGVLLLIFVARVSAAPRPATNVAEARGRLAIGLQARPWLTSFVICALAVTAPGSIIGVAPAVGTALVALLFHATWRTPISFDKAAAWTAALLVPALYTLFWWIPAEVTGSRFVTPRGGSWADMVLSPAVLLPLVLGLAFGRRPPGQRCGALDWTFLVIATTGAPAMVSVVMLADCPTQYAQIPAIYRVGMDHPQLWHFVTAVAWVPLFHRLVATDLSARRIVIGAAACGCIQLAGVVLATQDADSSIALSRGALYPVALWVAAALVLLLAREVARVWRIPDEHPIVADLEVPPEAP